MTTTDGRVDLLIKNGVVLTLDDQCSIFNDGCVAIKDGRVVFAGNQDELSGGGAHEVIDAAGGIIMPGLVNTHTHLPMSLFRGLADDLPLMTWLNDHIFPAEAKYMNKTSARQGTLISCAEMIMSGITTCCDGYFHEHHVAKALETSGMRGVLGQGIIDFPAPGVPDPSENIAHAMAFVDEWTGKNSLISPSVFCHSPYTCSADTLQKAKEAALLNGVLFQIHVAETKGEFEQCQKEHGCSPVERLDALGILDSQTLLVHCVWTGKSDIDLMVKRGCSVSHNPSSNMKLASGIAPVPEFIAAGVTVGLGTDSCASNNRLDIFSEMDLAAKLHKVNTCDPTVMDAQTVLRAATSGGAEAIGLGGEIGIIEQGKQADIIVIDTNKPHLTPMFNPISHMVYAASGSDVRDVVIGGRVIMKNRAFLTLDLERIIADNGQFPNG